MDGTQWECNSSDTLLNDFFSQDDLKQLAVDAGIMLECPLLVRTRKPPASFEKIL